MPLSLWGYRLTVEAYVIDQAGPKGARLEILSAADAQAIRGIFQTGGARIGSDHDTVHIDSFFGTIPHQTDTMPGIVRDDCRRDQRLIEASSPEAPRPQRFPDPQLGLYFDIR